MFVNIIGRSSCRTVQPNDVNTVRIPVEPEQYQRACTLAIWGHWRSGLL